jgi:hypothetical protein
MSNAKCPKRNAVKPDYFQLLKPTRVPYEESSVYSGINFQEPDLISEADLANLKHRKFAHRPCILKKLLFGQTSPVKKAWTLQAFFVRA